MQDELIIPKLKYDPYALYSYTKAFPTNNSYIGPLTSDDGAYTTDPNEMAGLLPTSIVQSSLHPGQAPRC